MINKYGENIFYSLPEEKSDRPALLLVKGSKYSCLLDSGNSKKHVNEFIDECGIKPDYCILSHYHWDHVCGLYWLADVKSYCEKTTYDKLKRYVDLKVTDENIETLFEPFCYLAMRYEYTDLSELKFKLPNETFTNNFSLDLGGSEVICQKVSNPHSDDSIICYLPKEKVIFVGDSCYDQLVGNDWVKHPDLLENFIEEINQYDYDLVIAGHSPAMNKEDFLNSLKEGE